jgi:hypothetical protein
MVTVNNNFFTGNLDVLGHLGGKSTLLEKLSSFTKEYQEIAFSVPLSLAGFLSPI